MPRAAAVRAEHAPATDGHVDETAKAHAPAESHPAAAAADHPAEAGHANAEHAATNDGEYVVKHGDTLTSIATSLHTTVDELIELNALKGDSVFEGQHLLVPAGEQ